MRALPTAASPLSRLPAQFLLQHAHEPVAFGVDPNGFLAVVGKPEQAVAAAADKKAAAAALESGKGGLFEHLMHVATHGSPAPKPAAEPPKPAAPAAPAAASARSVSSSSSDGSSSSSSSSVGGGGGAAPGPGSEPLLGCPAGCDPEAYARDKAAFLARWGREYGYGGRIESLYHKEVSCAARRQPSPAACACLPAKTACAQGTGCTLACRHHAASAPSQ